MNQSSTSLKITTPYLIAEFDSGSSGVSRLWRLDGSQGQMKWTERNGIDQNGNILVASSDTIYLYVLGQEFYASDFSWISYPLQLMAVDIYGRQWTGASDAEIDCVKCVSSTVIPLGGGRQIERIEHLFYPTMDGKGLVKHVSLVISRESEQSEVINSVVYGNMVGVNNGVRERFDVTHRAVESVSFGFDYNSVAEIEADWTIPAGATIVPARSTLYPNLLPDFDSSSWVVAGAPVKNSATSYTLNAGDRLRCWVMQPLPVERITAFRFDVTAAGGELRGRLGCNQKMNSIEYDVENTWTATGTKTLRTTSSSIDNAVFVEVECLSGSFTIENLVVQLRYDPEYVAYDGSHLGNRGFRNCVRLTGSALSGQRIMRTLSADLDISISQAAGLFLLPLGAYDSSPGFRFVFIDQDGVEHLSSPMDIWIDFNENYNNVPGRWNYWADGFYHEIIPDGVTTLSGIGIEILTDDPIDWLLDDFFVFSPVSRNIGPGGYLDTKFGLNARTTRQEDRCNRSYVIAQPKHDTRVTDRIQIVITVENTWYAEKSLLSAVNIDSSNPQIEIYELVSQTVTFLWSDLQDNGDTAVLVLPAGAELPEKITNTDNLEEYRILSYDQATNEVVFDVSSATCRPDHVIEAAYSTKVTVDPIHYNLEWDDSKGQYVIHWVDDDWVYGRDRDVFYCSYNVLARTDSTVMLQVAGDRQVRHIFRNNRDILSGQPVIGTFSRLFLSKAGNSAATGITVYYPHLDLPESDVLPACESVFAEVDQATNTRMEPLSPAVRSWNITPHISFGGEMVAEDPMAYADGVADRFGRGNIGNCIVGGGALTTAKSRLADYWFGWSQAVLDNGISMVDVMRDVIRRDYPETTVADNLSQHRYFVEITLLNYRWLCHHRQHIARRTDGTLQFKRVWYYETSDGSDYYVVQHAWDDMDPTYYDPVTAGGKIFYFQYHYIMNYPAFWSCVTTGDRWGEATILDHWLRLAGLYCSRYDCEGVIMSEMIISYKYANASNDLLLYNEWRVANGLAEVTDWPRDANGEVQVDDATIWDWKCWQVEQAVATAAAMVHGHQRLLGMSAEVEPVISVHDIDAPVWDGYTKESRYYQVGVEEPTLHWHVRELWNNCRRYGQDYDALLTADRCDFLYVWLYYRYCPETWYQDADGNFTGAIIDDFIAAYQHLRERMLVCIGLYPRSNPPPDSTEVKIAIKKLIEAGYNVAYAGYPRIITWEIYDDMWDWFADVVPSVRYNPIDDWVGIDPAGFGSLPLYIRY